VETVEWIDPDGVSTTLEVEWDVSGRGAPPVRMDEEDVPGQPGSRLRAVRHGARDFALPLWITSDTETNLRTEVRSLIASMDPTRGDGRIRVTGPGGDQREIVCRYQGGLELSETLGDTSGPLLQRAPAMFRAHDPYWADVSPTVTEWELGQAPGSFFPIFPIRLSSSEVFALDTVTNAGDVDAWPVWTITGPGSGIRMANLTTGKAWGFTVDLGTGESLTIDTRPGVKTVIHSSGANWWQYLSSTSRLWSLRRGVNSLRIEMGSATAESHVALSRTHKYLAV
jgi:phage-related protein